MTLPYTFRMIKRTQRHCGKNQAKFKANKWFAQLKAEIIVWQNKHSDPLMQLN